MKLRRHKKLFFILFSYALLYSFVFSQNEQKKTIKVGTFANDALYEKRGIEHNSSYLVDFLNTINRYNDWHFEYVELNTESAAQALSGGKVDILPFVGKGMDTEGDFLFSDIPSAVGSEVLASIAPKKMQNLSIAVTYNAPEEMLKNLESYASHQGFSYILKRYESQNKMYEAVFKGEVDAIASIDFGLPKDFNVIGSINPLFFYVAVSQKNKELYTEINQALSLSFNLNPEFLNALRKRYIPSADEGIFNFTFREKNYIDEKPLVKIAIVENQRPLSYIEKGKPKGIVIDLVKNIFSKSNIAYTFVTAKNYKDAVALVEDGKADVIYAITDTLNDEDAGFFKITSGMYKQNNVVITNNSGVSYGNCTFIAVKAYQYLSSFITVHYNPSKIQWCDSSEECIKLVKSTKNSFTVLPNLEIRSYENSNLFPNIKILEDGYTNNLCIGISRKIPSELCSILDKSIYKLSENIMETYLENRIVTSKGLQAAIKQHPYFFVALLILFILLLALTIFLVIYNTTKRKKDKQIAKAMNLANRDAMTGLYNHIAYKKLVSKSLEHQVLDERSAFVMIDIDNFKHINDTLGHGTGDLVIVTVSNILVSTFRQGDLKCRMGGDEFSVFMKNVSSKEGVEKKLSLLMDEVARTFRAMNLGVSVTCSVGAVICTGPQSDSFEKLYEFADKALYTVKNGGKNSFAISEEELVYNAEENFSIAKEGRL